MDPSKKYIALIAAVMFIIVFSALCRITYLLAARKALDFASAEMKSYMCGFIIGACCMLGIAVFAGVMPTRGGHFDVRSDPVLFSIVLCKVVALLGICAYGLAKSLQCKSWIVKIRK